MMNAVPVNCNRWSKSSAMREASGRERKDSPRRQRNAESELEIDVCWDEWRLWAWLRVLDDWSPPRSKHASERSPQTGDEGERSDFGYGVEEERLNRVTQKQVPDDA